MAAKSITGVVKSTQLEKNLGRTLMGYYSGVVDKMYVSRLGEKDANFYIPVLDSLIETAPNLKSKLIDLYDRTFGMEKGVTDVPSYIKMHQGALLDGLVFGYDVNTQTAELYTMNSKLLLGMDTDVEFIDKTIMKKNISGELKGYRIDVKYQNDSSTFEFKAVNHRKVLDMENVIMIPYISVVRGMKLLESFISGGAVLKLVQHIEGVEKVRAVTISSKVLSEFCDDGSAVGTVGCDYFPLVSMFYAPVVGAPSTTAMVTRVNLFNLDYVAKLKSMASLKKMGIEKCENPVRDMVAQNAVISALERIRSNSEEDYSALLDKFPKNDEIFTGDTHDGSEVSPIMVAKYMHQLNREDLERVYKLVPGVEREVQGKSFLMKKFEVIKPEGGSFTEGDIRRIVKEGICKILIRKTDCTMSSVLCTNNESILQLIYGKDYFGRYEGLGARLNKLNYMIGIEEAQPKEACEYCGFRGEEAEVILKAIQKELSKGSDGGSYSERIERAVDAVGLKIREMNGIRQRAASSSSGNVMARQLFANIDSEGKVQDYYRTVSVSKIVQVGVLHS